MHIELDMAQFSFISLFRSRSDTMEMEKLKSYYTYYNKMSTVTLENHFYPVPVHK